MGRLSSTGNMLNSFVPVQLPSKRNCYLDNYVYQSILGKKFFLQDYQQKGIRHRPNWDEQKDSIMMQVLMVKFSQNEKCFRILLSTKDEMLQEESESDRYWAAGRDGKGKNRLGQLLCQVRATLRAK